MINLDNKNQNESLLNKITKKVYNIIQKKGKRNEKFNMRKTGEYFRKNRMYSTNYNSVNSAKRTPNSLTVYHKNINTNKENTYLTNNHYRNNKFIFKSTLNNFNSKNNKSIKSPSLSEFTKFIQKNYQTLDGKSNNIQNLNININNQINILLNSNINEMQNFSINNNNNKMKLKTKNKHKDKSIDFNTNFNFGIKYKTNFPSFFSGGGKISKIKIFPNNNLIDINMKNRGNRNKNKFIYQKEKSNNNSKDKCTKKYNDINN